MSKRKSQRKKKKVKLEGRARRLHLAPEWVAKRSGAKPSNLLSRYRKYFGVDWECAIEELVALGIVFDYEYLSALRQTIARQYSNEKIHTPISRWEFGCSEGTQPESNHYFAYIAGYTSAGFPYGVTWEEMGEFETREQAE